MAGTEVTKATRSSSSHLQLKPASQTGDRRACIKCHSCQLQNQKRDSNSDVHRRWALCRRRCGHLMTGCQSSLNTTAESVFTQSSRLKDKGRSATNFEHIQASHSACSQDEAGSVPLRGIHKRLFGLRRKQLVKQSCRAAQMGLRSTAEKKDTETKERNIVLLKEWKVTVSPVIDLQPWQNVWIMYGLVQGSLRSATSCNLRLLKKEISEGSESVSSRWDCTDASIASNFCSDNVFVF
jgi:hypothetical protein